MFRKLWNAIVAVTEAMEELASSVKEANVNFRENLGLDHKEVEQVEDKRRQKKG